MTAPLVVAYHNANACLIQREVMPEIDFKLPISCAVRRAPVRQSHGRSARQRQRDGGFGAFVASSQGWRQFFAWQHARARGRGAHGLAG